MYFALSTLLALWIVAYSCMAQELSIYVLLLSMGYRFSWFNTTHVN